MTRFDHITIADAAELRFGLAPKPLTTRHGLTIGGGLVYPELNFTLPPMFVDESTMPEVRTQYWMGFFFVEGFYRPRRIRLEHLNPAAKAAQNRK